jgi:hypothetical protein
MRTTRSKNPSTDESPRIISLFFLFIAIMNTTLYFLLLQYCFAANAQTRRQLLRLRNVASNSVLLCAKITLESYKTKSVSRSNALVQTSMSQAVYGACQSGSVCKNLCSSFESFKIADTKCLCLATVSSTNVAPPTCGSNAELTSDKTACQCVTGYEGDPLAGCTKKEVIMCANPYGNPCGPNSACTDTPTGISCTPTNLEGCPGGCGPNSTCNNSPSGYQCDCNLGFYRKQLYLPCEAGP